MIHSSLGQQDAQLFPDGFLWICKVGVGARRVSFEWGSFSNSPYDRGSVSASHEVLLPIGASSKRELHLRCFFGQQGAEHRLSEYSPLQATASPRRMNVTPAKRMLNREARAKFMDSSATTTCRAAAA